LSSVFFFSFEAATFVLSPFLSDWKEYCLKSITHVFPSLPIDGEVANLLRTC